MFRGTNQCNGGGNSLNRGSKAVKVVTEEDADGLNFKKSARVMNRMSWTLKIVSSILQISGATERGTVLERGCR